MSDLKKYIALVGSRRSPLAGAREIGAANLDERVDVTVLLRSRAGDQAIVNADVFNLPPRERTLLSRDEFEQRYGASPESIARLEAFAHEQGVTVKERSVARRTVILSGTLAAMTAAFGVALMEYQHFGRRYRARAGAIHIPVDLHDIIEGVFGLDNRRQAKPHFRRLRRPVDTRSDTASHSYTPPQVAALYNFPSGVNGSGVCIALIELGGGFNSTDLNDYWSQLGVTAPNVSAVSVGNGSNDPTGEPNGPDGGVMLDIEVAGSIAPGAKIVVYFAENTDAGFLNAITSAVHDRANNPSIVSISWGAPECSWTHQAMRAIHHAFEAAASIGVTVCVAAGDDGSTDGVNDGLNHVDFPASSPFALGCGGTSLLASGSTIAIETVWNQLANGNGATGGGIAGSDIFVLPSWQAGLGVPPSANDGHIGRGVPDVAGNADPFTGYITRVNGKSDVIGGTGGVSSLWAGLIALINQTLGKPLGYINPFLALRASNPEGFRGITLGNNGAYHAGPGWNACAGLGAPVGNDLAKLLGEMAGATDGAQQGAGAGALDGTAPRPEREILHERLAASPWSVAEARAKPSTTEDAAPDNALPRAELVHLGASAPRSARPGSQFTAQFAAYIPTLKEEVHKQLMELSPRAKPNLEMKVCRWRPGTVVTVILVGDNLAVEPGSERFTWSGSSNVESFLVRVAPNAPEGVVVLQFHVIIAETRVALLPLELEIDRAADPGQTHRKQTDGLPYRTAFASYASKDRPRVIDRIRSLEISADIDVFQDCLDLKPGEEWKAGLEKEIKSRDLFILFWCEHAKASPWVTWEWETALAGNGKPQMQIQPLVPIDKAPPPNKLKHLHMDDPAMKVRSYDEEHPQ